MEKSQDIGELVLALSRAQGEFPAVPFNAVNPFLKNRYADLGSVIETAKEILSNHQLVVTQTMTNNGTSVGVTTMLAHSSGQWISDTVTLPLSDEKGKSLAQVAGSVVTYLRRYAYSAILGLYADEDTDGNNPEPKQGQKLVSPQKPAVQKPVAPSPQPESTSPEEQPEATVEMVTLWDGKHQKPANELVDGESAVKFVKASIGVGKAFESQNHAKSHLHAHYNIAYDLKDTMAQIVCKLTWKQFVALMKHVKGMGDDPAWYPARFGKDAQKQMRIDDPESDSGYSAEYLDSIVAIAGLQDGKLKGLKTYTELTNEQKVDTLNFLMTSVGEDKNIRPDDLAIIAGVLSA